MFVVTRRAADKGPFLVRNYETKGPFHSSGECKGWRLFEAALASGSAHTYFPPFVKSGVNYRDGGLGYNSPSHLAFMEALDLVSPDASAAVKCVVSLGTGAIPPVSEEKLWLAPHLRQVVNAAIDQACDVHDTNINMQKLSALHDFKYFRLDPPLPEAYDLALSSREHLQHLQRLTQAYLSDVGDKILKDAVQALVS